MSWWQWALMLWFSSSLVWILLVAIADWWWSIDREWKAINNREIMRRDDASED